MLQAYVANLQANLGSDTSIVSPASLLASHVSHVSNTGQYNIPAYHQLAAAHRLANIQRTLMASTCPTTENQVNSFKAFKAFSKSCLNCFDR